MTYAIILTSTFLAIALAAALVREHRLRRALEALLKRIIAAWRSQHADTESSGRPENVRADDRHDDRLQ
jgi:hypothetical protein